MTGFDTQPTPGATEEVREASGTSACIHTAIGAAELLLDAVAVQDGDMLLDLVSGLGHGAGLASQRGAIATGIDRSEVLLNQAKRLYPNALYYPGDPESLVFASGFFTAVIHHGGLQETPSPAALAEAFRVLRPGGRYAALWLAAPWSPASGKPAAAAPCSPGDVPADLRSGCTAAGFTEVLCGAVTLRGNGAADWTAFRISAVKPR